MHLYTSFTFKAAGYPQMQFPCSSVFIVYSLWLLEAGISYQVLIKETNTLFNYLGTEIIFSSWLN